MSQTDKIIRAMLKGWQSTASLIHCGGGNTPLKRLTEWRKAHGWMEVVDSYLVETFLYNGKYYREKTRWVESTNFEHHKVRYLERRLVAIKCAF